jgi:hypothetical protein
MTYAAELAVLISVMVESGYTKEQAIVFAENLDKAITTPKTEGK